MKGAQILHTLLEYSKLNSKSFSEKIGLNRPQAIYDILKGKTQNISANMADKIVSVFPEINRGWLLTGEGPMLKPESIDSDTNQQTQDSMQNRFFDALERKDRQMDELLNQQGQLLEQNKRLISVIETMTDTHSKQTKVG